MTVLKIHYLDLENMVSWTVPYGMTNVIMWNLINLNPNNYNLLVMQLSI